MQLGEEDEGYLRCLQVAQPGDRPFGELSLEEVTLDPERVSHMEHACIATISRPRDSVRAHGAAQ